MTVVSGKGLRPGCLVRARVGEAVRRATVTTSVAHVCMVVFHSSVLECEKKLANNGNLKSTVLGPLFPRLASVWVLGHVFSVAGWCCCPPCAFRRLA